MRLVVPQDGHGMHGVTSENSPVKHIAYCVVILALALALALTVAAAAAVAAVVVVVEINEKII